MPTEKQLRNLSRGKGRTKTPRVHVGCLPCSQGRYVADIEHANRWIEMHWTRCPRTALFSSGDSEALRASSNALRGGSCTDDPPHPVDEAA